MFKKIMESWTAFYQWVDGFSDERPSYDIPAAIKRGNAEDELQIERQRRAIVNAQWHSFMAKARIEARARWQELQRERAEHDAAEAVERGRAFVTDHASNDTAVNENAHEAPYRYIQQEQPNNLGERKLERH